MNTKNTAMNTRNSETHAHTHPDTPDAYLRGSMDHANRISEEETRGRIPRGEIGIGEEELGEGERVSCTRISLNKFQINNQGALITEG